MAINITFTQQRAARLGEHDAHIFFTVGERGTAVTGKTLTDYNTPFIARSVTDVQEKAGTGKALEDCAKYFFSQVDAVLVVATYDGTSSDLDGAQQTALESVRKVYNALGIKVDVIIDAETFGYDQGLDSVSITGTGTGYNTTVTISAPDISGGTQATATASVTSGNVTGITIDNAGSGYINPPTISVGGGGSGQTFTANMKALTVAKTLATSMHNEANRIAGCVAVINSGHTEEADYRSYLANNHKGRNMPVFGVVTTPYPKASAAMVYAVEMMKNVTLRGKPGGFSNFYVDGVSDVEPEIEFDPTNTHSLFKQLEVDLGSFFARDSHNGLHGFGSRLNPSGGATNNDSFPAFMIIKSEIERDITDIVLGLYHRRASLEELTTINNAFVRMIRRLVNLGDIDSGEITIPLTEINHTTVDATGYVIINKRVVNINVHIDLRDLEVV